MPAEIDLDHKIIQLISESKRRITFASLLSSLKSSHTVEPKTLKSKLSRLIESGKLRYTYQLGESFIEVAYDRPNVISDRVVLLPANCSLKGFENYVPVRLLAGISFGAGDHSSTRLAVQLIDRLMNRPPFRNSDCKYRALDIGTGSGVLAIATAKLSMVQVDAIDIDPCSINEARCNAKINGAENCIRVSDMTLDALSGPYDLVMANLRTPTLLAIRKKLKKRIKAGKIIILSGMKENEVESVCSNYVKSGFFPTDRRSEKGWSAVCFVRGPMRALVKKFNQ
ncbi:MAG: hypothetical protein CR984_06790 [Proteobacteria bacterium]|nr:MAG: hypothetical protein CR984_06790 [Pseudomonadota bacterium]PIE64284.1 MAG: hypothetical protein CSA26_09030 [Desulfobacterales bacterium]